MKPVRSRKLSMKPLFTPFAVSMSVRRGSRASALVAALGCAAAAVTTPGGAFAATTATTLHGRPATALAAQPAVVRATDALHVTAGQEVLVRLNADATSVFVADPEVADVHVPSPRVLLVLGKKAGTTTLYALGANNAELLKRTVSVGQDLDSLRRMVAARFPDMNLRIDAGPGSLQLSGDARSADDANAVVQMVTPYLAEKQVLVNRMTIARPLQVQLRVRITEVDRNVTQQLGINWQSLGAPGANWLTGILSGRQIFNTGAVTSTGAAAPTVNLPTNNAFSLLTTFTSNRLSLQAMLDVLNQEGLLTVLAEPNLVALSGQTASFLAGGEFPIPVSQVDGAITVEFKQFGVKLDFTPTVMNDRRISLKVRPEVSQLDTSASIVTNGISIPGLSVRRADTTVELASGQSFAIAGLLQTNTSDIVSQVPGLGSLPILGKLFSSTNYQNNKTELVILVTPYLVEPTDPSKLRTPIESVVSPIRDIEYGFERAFGIAPAAAAPRLVGVAGYIY